jgi:hypothetical protein
MYAASGSIESFCLSNDDFDSNLLEAPNLTSNKAMRSHCLGDCSGGR